MNELDLTAAESKATYEEIKDYVLEHTGLKVSNLYIAQVKEKCGIIERANYNLPKSEILDSRSVQKRGLLVTVSRSSGGFGGTPTSIFAKQQVLYTCPACC